MATTMTLADLRTAVRQQTDTEGDTHIQDSELTSYINQSYFELYDILVQKYGDNYFVQTPYSFATDGVNQRYDLPADFYKLLGVDLTINSSTSQYITLKPFTFSDRNKYVTPNAQSFYGHTNLRYRLNGSQIWFTPIPAGGQNVRVWYVPKMTTLSLDTDTLDGISGWTEYVIVDAAIKVMTKQESDPSVFIARKDALLRRIESAAENRDAANPATVSDTLFQEYQWPMGDGSGYFGG